MTKDDVAFWKEMRSLLPDLPVKEVEGRRIYSPAEAYDATPTNQENPELYAVFPFALCHVGTKDLQQGIDTYNKRIIRNVHGWTQDGQQAARLGLTDEAQKNLLGKLRYRNPNHRFPVIWGPNFDWSPDQDHGSNLLMTLQDMVMQAYGDKVYMLPAFPKEWNVKFKLFVPGGNSLTGEYRQGKWIGKPSMGKKNAQKLRMVFK